MFIAQGWFVVKEDLDGADVQAFELINNSGNQRIPPNLQSLTVSDANLDGVRVAVYRSTGAGLKTILRTEFKVGTVGGGYNQSGDSDIELDAQDRAKPMPADVPSTGVLRILDPNDTGTYLFFAYDTVDRTNGRFHLTSGTIGAVTGGQDLVDEDNAHVVFIEEEVSGTSVSNTIQYVAPGINLFWVARLKGWLPADGTSSFGTGGAAIAANLQPDENVDLP
jgi:hypothetical protein